MTKHPILFDGQERMPMPPPRLRAGEHEARPRTVMEVVGKHVLI
jgi:hypothetical protein